MFEITIPGEELWDARRAVTLRLEYSLVSLSKWESKWHIPFFDDSMEKTPEQMQDFVRCMTVTQGVDPTVYARLTVENLNAIYRYMEDPMTATWFAGEGRPGEKNQNGTAKRRARRRPPSTGKVLTSEVLYSRMFQAGVPIECERWHLNRLMTLIRVCQEEQAPPRKMSRKDALRQRRELNAARMKKYGAK
jgi:hypothetical protein